VVNTGRTSIRRLCDRRCPKEQCRDVRVTHRASATSLLAAFSFIGLTAANGLDARAPGEATTDTSPNVPADSPSVANSDEVETPTSTEQGRSPIDQSFPSLTYAQWVVETRRRALRDTKFYAELRSFYLDSDNLNGTENEAWALGGSAGFKTGYFRDLFAIGATGYTSQRLYGPEEKDGTQLLAPGQHGYTVVGELYSEFLLVEGVSAIVGSKEYETPFINGNDSRMTPNTFEAATVLGSLGGADGAPGLRFGAGYFDRIKERDSDEFVSMAEAAGARAGVSRGVTAAGAIYSMGDLSLGAIDYYSSDIINIVYTEAKDAIALTAGLRLQLAAQYTNQKNVGDNLLMGHAFSADQFGLKAELAFAGALLTTAYTRTGDGTSMQSPWSGYPGYTSVQIANFDRNGENAWMLRAAYDFRYAKSLSAYALYVHGSQPEAPRQYAQDEYDLNLQWKQSSGKLRGLKVLLRYGHVSQAGPVELHTDQLRLILYYDLPWL
jgi:hypothetical protein